MKSSLSGIKSSSSPNTATEGFLHMPFIRPTIGCDVTNITYLQQYGVARAAVLCHAMHLFPETIFSPLTTSRYLSWFYRRHLLKRSEQTAKLLYQSCEARRSSVNYQKSRVTGVVYTVPQRYQRSAKQLARSSTTTCANQMMSLLWYKDGGHIVRH